MAIKDRRKKEEPKKELPKKEPVEKKTVEKKSEPKVKPSITKVQIVKKKETNKKEKQEIEVPSVSSLLKKESIGISGTGPIAVKFRKLHFETGANISYTLCKLLDAFNKSKE